MIYCKNCETVIEEHELIKTENNVPYGLGEITESIVVECPHCYSNNLEYDADIVVCEDCGKELLESDANYDVIQETYYCDKCWNRS
jgi:uncharacterized protein (DUF983 family)